MHLCFQLEAEKRNLSSGWKAMEIRLEPHLLEGKGREVGEEGVKKRVWKQALRQHTALQCSFSSV